MSDQIDHTPPTLGLRSVPLSELHEWPANPRQTHDPEAHTTLVASISAQGLLQPLLVRPRMVPPALTPEEAAEDAEAARQHKGKVVARPRVAEGYEVIAGNRRLRALAVIGGDPLVPVLVRDMDDDTALAAAIKENGDRDGLAPLEEARAFAALTKHLDNGYGSGVAGAAALTGKSEAHIRQRLRLLDLCAPAQAFLAAGGLQLGGALVLAQLRDHADQCSALEQAGYLVDEAEGSVMERLPQDGLPTLARWRIIVSNLGRRISKAPFPISLAILTQAGACAPCPKRSDAQASLFADATDGVCLDRACWDQKVIANDRRILDEAERNGRLLTLDKTSKLWLTWGERPDTLPDAEWQAVDGGATRPPVELTPAQRKQVRVAVDSNGHAREVIPLALMQELRAAARAALIGDSDGDGDGDGEDIDDGEAAAKRAAVLEAARKARADKMAEEAKAKEIRQKVDEAVAKVFAAVDINDAGVMVALAVAAAHVDDDVETSLNQARAMDDSEAARFALKALLNGAWKIEAATRDVLAALGGESYDEIVERVTNPPTPKKPRKRAGTAASARAEQEGAAE
jgi:ParB/RepB/Spo0J family partition protein